MKLLEEKMRKIFATLGKQRFLRHDAKGTNNNIDTFNFIKIKYFCSSKNTI